MNRYFQDIISLIYNFKRQVSILSIILGLVSILILQIFKSPIPLRLTIANLGSTSAAVVFMTYQPTNACAYVYQPKQFLKGRLLCNQETTTHLLAVKDLEPETNYQIIIRSGLRITKQNTPSFTTLQIQQEAPSLPEPAFGRVRTQNGNPVKNALILVFPDKDIAKGVATKTNDQGNFSLDISSFDKIATTVTVDASTVEGLWGNQTFPVQYHAPFNDIVVSPIAITSQ